MGLIRRTANLEGKITDWRREVRLLNGFRFRYGFDFIVFRRRWLFEFENDIQMRGAFGTCGRFVGGRRFWRRLRWPPREWVSWRSG